MENQERKIDPNIVERVQKGEVHLIVCNIRGERPGVKAPFPLAKEKCELCNGDVYIDAANIPLIKKNNLMKCCITCYIVLFMGHIKPDHMGALVGGQELTVEEGMASVKAIVDPPPKDKEN